MPFSAVVHRGSVLGSSLFVAFINDLTGVETLVRFRSFVDKLVIGSEIKKALMSKKVPPFQFVLN